MPNRHGTGVSVATDSLEAWCQFPSSPRSAGRARALLRDQLAAWNVESDVAHIAELLLSELATNAIQHARTPAGREIGVRLARHDGMLRVEVADANNRRPEPRSAPSDDEGGRGLTLVAVLADRWGCCPRRHGIGKSVWAELKLG
ncbi:ATP-binding protein [Streptomyces sp. NBC_01794]|uniref:ATP-binding protein n=1 Tax=Streptomyces sp. NBC_01794 TaxID=2975942 RepID=UPI003090013E|nr:ATP-binding protein [Streptomyces sp. NBC_01794]